MRWEKGKTYWYFIRYLKEKQIGVVKVSAIRDSDNLFGGLKIEKILTPKTYLGHENRIREGAEISANELQGVGGDGPDHYFFQSRELISKIF